MIPDITVIVAAYNGDAQYLPRACASLEAQEFQDFEVIIAFDGPPDEKAEAIFESLNQFDLDIRVIAGPEQTGYYCIPRNYAIPLARGHYIINLDADNEFDTDHLAALIEEIREVGPDGQTPDMTYTRREYVVDPEADPDKHITGESPLTLPTPQRIMGLHKSPYNNFIDTSEFLIAKSVLYELAEKTGVIWNPECRRFGDWELMTRLFGIGIRARAVDQASLIYHWTGKNLQTTRNISDVDFIPAQLYEKLKEEGKIATP